MYVCTHCGGQGEPEQLVKTEDDRYAPGHCPRCTPFRKVKRSTEEEFRRSTVQLIREDLWDPDLLASRQKRDREQRAMRVTYDAKTPETPTDEDQAIAQAALDRVTREARQRKESPMG